VGEEKKARVKGGLGGKQQGGALLRLAPSRKHRRDNQEPVKIAKRESSKRGLPEEGFKG